MADVSTPSTSSGRPSAGVPVTTVASASLVGSAIVVGSAALFGTLGPVSRVAFEAGVEPPAWVAWRASIGLLAIVAVIGWRVRRGRAVLVRPSDLTDRTKVGLLLAGITGFTLNLCLFAAFDRITVALALLCFYTYPALVAAVHIASGREPLDAPRALALLLSMVGMVAVVASQLDPAAGVAIDPLGIAFAAGAAISQTIYVTIARSYKAVPSDQAIAVVMGITVIGATATAILVGSAASLAIPATTPSLIPLVLFTGICAAAVPSLGFLVGIRLIGGLRAGILMLFEPVVGVALAAWLLSERLTAIQVAGAVAILVAAVILQRAAPEADEPASHTAVAVGGGP